MGEPPVETMVGLEPVRADAGQCLVEEFLRLGPAGLGRVQHEARKRQPLGGRDLARQRNGFRRRLDAGALAPGSRIRPRPTAGGPTRRPPAAGPRPRSELSAATVMLALACSAREARHLLLADQIVADQDVVDPGFRHHLGLADLLAGDALGAGRDLHLRQQRALVGLDMRPVGDAGGVAGHLDAGDVALDAVHVDDSAGRAVFAGDLGGEGRCHARSLCWAGLCLLYLLRATLPVPSHRSSAAGQLFLRLCDRR